MKKPNRRPLVHSDLITLKISPDLRDQLRAAAAANSHSMSAEVRQALQQRFRRSRKEAEKAAL